MRSPDNECGGCQMCCLELPIATADLRKPAGEPCQHLCAAGCSLHGETQRPQVCCTFLCGWRADPWLGRRPDYRPDRLGVIFQLKAGTLSLFEGRAGAFDQESVRYIVGRLRGQFAGFRIKWHGHACAHGADLSLLDRNGALPLPDGCAAEERGGDVVFRRRPLPLV